MTSVGGGAIEEAGEGVVERGGGFGGGGRGYDEVNDCRVCGAGKLRGGVSCLVNRESSGGEEVRERGGGEGGGENVNTLMILSDTQLRRSAIVAWLKLLG